MTLTEYPEQRFIHTAFERRAAPRFHVPANVGRITNLTRFTGEKPASILDMSRSGMRIETELAASPGDALRIDLPNSTLFVEAVYCEQQTLMNKVLGLKLLYTANHEQLGKYDEPNSKANGWV